MPRRYFRPYLATGIDPAVRRLRDDWFSNNLSRTDINRGRAIIRDTFSTLSTFPDMQRPLKTPRTVRYFFLLLHPYYLLRRENIYLSRVRNTDFSGVRYIQLLKFSVGV